MAAGPAPNNLNLFFTFAEATLNQVWAELDEEVPDVWKEFATEKTFPTLQHVDGWTDVFPKAREWIGSRVVHELSASTYAVLSRPWEHTAGIDRFTADADLIGLYADRTILQARAVRRHPSIWTRNLLEASGEFAGTGLGTANPQLGTDGLTFFNTSHLQGAYQLSGPTYSNDFTGGGLNVAGGMPGGSGPNILVGGAFSPTAMMTLAEYMMQYRGADGEVLGVAPHKAMFPTSMFGEAQLVLKSLSFAPPAWATITGQVGAADNPILKYGIEPIINRFLTIGNRWYLFDATASRKPMGWGVHKQPVYAQMVAENTESVFMRHYYVMGYYGHAVPFWSSFPFMMARSSA